MKSNTSKSINLLAATWLFVAIGGQFAFFLFILSFYALTALSGDLAQWNNNPLLIQPPVNAANPIATGAFGIHAIGAGYIALMGGIQLLTPIRNRFPRFHHWNGRFFLSTVVLLTAAGFYLVWVRGPVPTQFNDFGTSVNGFLILLFAFYTLRYALRRDFAAHQRWAVRLYLVANAQWFLRIGGFGYFLSMQALGVEVAFEGLFFELWIWGCFVVPLIMSELYFRARQSDNAFLRRTTIAGLSASIAFTALGSAVFSFFMLQLATGNVA